MQGPRGDWHTEAPKMASIYQNALLTVAFVDSTSLMTASIAASSTPFLSKLDIQHINSGKRLPFDVENPESIYSWLDKNGNFVARPDGELDTRGWTFQERLLSTRILSITRAGFFWDCLHNSASDQRLLGIQGDFSLKFRDSNDRKLRACLLTGTNVKEGPDANPSISRPFALWRRIVQDYTTRKLRRESDRVIALEGVMQLMSQVLRDEYVLGIWRSDAHRSLVWFVEPTSESMELPSILNEPPAINAPSWSWVSVGLPIQYRLWHPFARYIEGNRESYTPCCEIMSLYAQRNNEVSFDSYKGEICINGALAEIETAELLNASGCQFIIDPRPAVRFSEEFPRYLSLKEYQNAVLGQSVFVLPIMEGGYSILRAQYCLVLQPTERLDAAGTSSDLTMWNFEVRGSNVMNEVTGCTKFKRLGLFITDRLISSICVNCPSTCKDERCVQKCKVGDKEAIGRRCQGQFMMIRIV